MIGWLVGGNTLWKMISEQQNGVCLCTWMIMKPPSEGRGSVPGSKGISQGQQRSRKTSQTSQRPGWKELIHDSDKQWGSKMASWYGLSRKTSPLIYLLCNVGCQRVSGWHPHTSYCSQQTLTLDCGDQTIISI